MSPESHTGVPETDEIKAVRQFRRAGTIDPDHVDTVAEYRRMQHEWDTAELPEETVELVNVDLGDGVSHVYHPDGERYVSQWYSIPEEHVVEIERECEDDESESE